MIKIIPHRKFEKDYQKLRTAEKRRVQERIMLFAKDPFDPILNNHGLKGKYEGYRSINVGGNLRALYKLAGEETVIFVAIDTHSKLYSL